MKSIIMSTEDVLAVLDGRKTMARQVVKFKNGSNPFWSGYTPDGAVLYGGNNVPAEKSPYQAGDVLLVRETWAAEDCALDCPGRFFEDECPFKRVGEKCYKYKQQYVDLDDLDFKWNSPVTMPREAARLFLRVTDVRVERVQDISEKDAKREGVCGLCYDAETGEEKYDMIFFKIIWDARNAKRGYGWDSNPFVWVISFERFCNTSDFF